MKKSSVSSFEILDDMIYVLSKNKIKNINIIGQAASSHRAKSSKMEQLYEGIHNGKFKNDEDAALALGYDSAKNTAYIKLKHELKKRLLNTLLFIDTEQPFFTDLEKARYNAKREWACIDVLWLRGASKSAVFLAEELFQYALYYEITFVALDIAKKLLSHYSLHGDKKKYNYYHEQCNLLQKTYQAETEAEICNSELMILSARNNAHKPALVSLSENCLTRLSTYDDIHSVTFLGF